MSFSAEVVAHSAHPGCPDLITVKVSYPRFIHSELMTHREFSRNASSSRAIPVARQLKNIINDPASPVHWGSNMPGMQAKDELTGWRRGTVKALWKLGCYNSVAISWLMMKAGAHKQIVNRVAEPYAHISVLITSSNWSNFFYLRDHEDAQPEIELLAQKIKDAILKSKPEELRDDEWHLPFIEWNEKQAKINSSLTVHGSKDHGFAELREISTARCARLSYDNFDGTRDPEKDKELYHKLVGAEPLHASPTEHQALPDPHGRWKNRWGNFQHWLQNRKLIPNEAIKDPDAWKSQLS